MLANKVLKNKFTIKKIQNMFCGTENFSEPYIGMYLLFSDGLEKHFKSFYDHHYSTVLGPHMSTHKTLGRSS